MATTLGGQGKAQGGDGHPEKRKKESILDLTKFLEKPVRVKFAGEWRSPTFLATLKLGRHKVAKYF
jgi:hypothetical protein